jgi:bacterioferritin-associated ferredoxin
MAVSFEAAVAAASSVLREQGSAVAVARGCSMCMLAAAAVVAAEYLSTSTTTSTSATAEYVQ